MKYFLRKLARVLHIEKYDVVIAAIMLFSGLCCFGIITFIIFSTYGFKEILHEFEDNIVYILASFLIFIISRLLIRLESKYYEPYVIINGDVYIPIVTRHYPDIYSKPFESRCSTCAWKDKCKAWSTNIENCDHYQRLEEGLRVIIDSSIEKRLNGRQAILTRINKIISSSAKWLFYIILLGISGLIISGILKLLDFDEKKRFLVYGFSMLAIGIPLLCEILLGLIYFTLKQLLQRPAEGE